MNTTNDINIEPTNETENRKGFLHNSVWPFLMFVGFMIILITVVSYIIKWVL